MILSSYGRKWSLNDNNWWNIIADIENLTGSAASTNQIWSYPYYFCCINQSNWLISLLLALLHQPIKLAHFPITGPTASANQIHWFPLTPAGSTTQIRRFSFWFCESRKCPWSCHIGRIFWIYCSLYRSGSIKL